jgi:hypothetical protein
MSTEALKSYVESLAKSVEMLATAMLKDREP